MADKGVRGGHGFWGLALLAGLAEVLLLAPPALAHRDPASCSGSGVQLQIFPFRNSGVQCVQGLNTEPADCSFDTTDPENLVSVGCSPGFTCDPTPLGGGVVSPCETILYRGVLSYSGNNTCAFGGGNFTLTTPGDTFTVSNPVPCLGGSVAPCTGETSITSKLYPYTVQPGDTAISSQVDYAGGVVHNGGATPPTGDQAGAAAMIVDIATVISCDDNNACTTDICIPEEQGVNACDSSPITCDDNNACTTDTCDPAQGCVTSPIPPCDDNNVCTTDTCDPAQGCVFNPIAPPCNDNNACTNDTCDPALGCVSSPITPPCNDNNLCTNDTCDPVQGCVTSPIAPCSDNNLCTNDTCDPAQGCVFSPISPACNDNNACTTDTCDPAQGCVSTPITPACNDNNVCTTDTCDPAQGCVSTPIAIPCDDDDPCTDDTCHPTLGCQFIPNNNPECVGNHFQCYEIKPFAFPRRTATVADRYDVEGTRVTLTSPNRLCAPSDKFGEDPTAPLDPEHLTTYPIRTPFSRVPNQTIANQFGTVRLDLVRRAFLMVPAAKSLGAPPPPLEDPITDHYQCYRVRRSTGGPRFTRITGVTASDQFGSHAMDLLRPRFFCTPANKNDEDPGALSSTQNLLCYKARHRVRFPELEPNLNDQFLQRRVKIIRRLEFCVPSTLVNDSGE